MNAPSALPLHIGKYQVQAELGRGASGVVYRAADAFKRRQVAIKQLHAHLLRREVFGNVVVDHEDLSRTFPEGPGRMELVCVYVVEGGLIRSASFAFGPPCLTPSSSQSAR